MCDKFVFYFIIFISRHIKWIYKFWDDDDGDKLYSLLFQNFLGFGQSAEVDILFDGSDNRKLAEVKTDDGKKEKYLLYYDGEAVSGKVC